MPNHQAQQGETISRIAAAHGMSFDAVWNAPENTELRETRPDPNVLFEPLLGGGGGGRRQPSNPFARSFFVPFVSSTKSLDQNNQSDYKWENSLKRIWDRLAGGSNPSSTPPPPSPPPSSSVCSVQAALSTLRTYARQNNTKQIHVLVTGSLYLVGDLLRILKRIP